MLVLTPRMRNSVSVRVIFVTASPNRRPPVMTLTSSES